MVFERLVECERNGSCRSIAVLGERNHDFVWRNTKLLADAVQDALVGLVWHVEINFGWRVACRDQGFLDDARDLLHSVAEDLAPVHAQQPGSLGRARATVDVEQVLEAPVRPDARGENAAILARADLRLRLEHDRTGAVAEQYARAAVFPVENARKCFGSDHKHALGLTGFDEIVGDVEAINEARTYRLHVEGSTFRDTEAGLDLHGGRRKSAIRRGSRADYEIDVGGIDAGADESLTRRRDSEIRGQLAVIRNVALLDSGTLLDPFVSGVDEESKVVVGHDAFGQIGTHAADHRSNDRHVSPRPGRPQQG